MQVPVIYTGILFSFSVPLLEKGCVFLLIFENFQIIFKITLYDLATPVSSLTVLEAHREFGKLTNSVTTRNDELLSGKYGEAGSDQFIG